MINPFGGANPGVLGPYVSATAITPADVNVLPTGTSYRGLWIGGAGNVSVILRNDTAPVTFTLAAGFAPLWVRQVLATGTTATNILGLN